MPLTECDYSAVATLAQMGTNSGSFPTAVPLPRPSSVSTPDGIPVDPNVPNPDPSGPILLSSTRIETSGTADRATLDAAIDALYLRLDLQQTVFDHNQSMETALKKQMIQNCQLNEYLQAPRTYESPFVLFAQSKYDRLRVLYETGKQSEFFREALADRIDQTALVEYRKSKIFQTVRACHDAQEKANREIAEIRKQMDEAGERMVAECETLYQSLEKANHKKSKYKQISNQLQEKLRRALKNVSRLQYELGEAQKFFVRPVR